MRRKYRDNVKDRNMDKKQSTKDMKKKLGRCAEKIRGFGSKIVIFDFTILYTT